jgi:hypothetical protein
MGSRRNLVKLAGWFFVATSQIAWTFPAPSPIQQQAAEAVIRDLGIDSDSALVEQNLKVLAPYTSLPTGAAIKVVSARAGYSAGTWVLRLDCVSRRDCLPFHAVLRVPQLNTGGLPEGESGKPKLTAVQFAAAVKQLNAPPVTRQGQEIELVADLPGVRLREKVVCLQAGALGERIRVQSRGSHRVLLATVAGSGLVKVEQ